MNPRWFVSKTVRQARDMRKHVTKLLSAQRDLLSTQAIAALETALRDMRQAYGGGAADGDLKKQMTALETAANKWLKPYPNPGLRENIEVLLVALSVAMGIRTFFLQPFKIPTGSMQPTFFGIMPGITPDPGYNFRHNNQADLQIPGPITRFFDYWINGNSYYNEIAPEDGEIQAVKEPVKAGPFNLSQQYEFNGQWHTVWFPADDLFQRAGYIDPHPEGGLVPHHLKAGDPILRVKVTAGDHLFVDRLSYNFRRPARGDIVVFETKGIPANMRRIYKTPDDEFFIKRLVALPGEHVQIGDDRHLIIDGKRLDKTTPHFENVYGFDPAQPPMESHYSGHVNGRFAEVPLFPNQDAVYTVKPGEYMVMGDNTMNSLDSRFWGSFPEQYVIGKYFFVYWPFSSRFGMNVR